jgi:LacI family transcriptional regulator
VKNKKVTIHDIAARLNMSASTISRALSGYSRISEKTQELVKQTAVEMNYKPNQLASNLRKGRGNMIGVIIPRINRHFFSHVIAGMEIVTNPAGYNLIICQTNEEYENEKRSLQTLINNRVDGVIMSISSETIDDKHIQSAIDEGISVALFDRVFPNLNVDLVVNDNFMGGYLVTKHLIDQGYKRIIHFSGPLRINVYADRLNGYKKAMEEAHLPVLDTMIFNDVITREKGEAIALELYENKNLPDAIFSVSDYSALGAMLVLKKKGVEIPKEIGIAGFSNEPFTEFIEPGITTLEQHSVEIGKSVARMLIDRIENKKDKQVTDSKIFQPELIIRASTLRKGKK